MKIEEIRRKVEGIPHMTFLQAKAITKTIADEQPLSILELGFRHGVSTCYMAGALDTLGRGHVTTIDLLSAREAEPNVESLLADLGLSDLVTVYYEPTSYTWRLMKMLEEVPSPRFDLCYVDGAHNWFTDGFAFFLVDRMLEPGGLIIFDDLEWTYDSSPVLKDSDLVQHMPEEERTAAQVRKVFELLVMRHPSYGEFVEKDGWAYARKKREGVVELPEAWSTRVVYRTEPPQLRAALRRMFRRARGLVKS